MGSLSYCMCPPSSPHSKPHLTNLSWPPLMQAEQRLLNWTEKILLHAVAGVLSFSFSSNSVAVAVEAAAGLPSHSATAPDCRKSEEGGDEVREFSLELVPNRRIVEEAWQIVNDSFFDAHLHSWSTEKWLKNQEEILSGSIDTRSQAHDIIRSMLASLADPYTRFLTPSEFSKMARYDITGVGMNLREVPNDDGSAKLKVLGIVLGGPAHSAGVRQGDEVLSVNGEEVTGRSAFEVSSLLQGPKDTFVTIEFRHGNCGPIQSVKIQRQLIARTPVFYRLDQTEDGNNSVGYIRINEFNALARKDLIIALRHLQDSGASYFVLDLRNNLGGLVQAGIEVAKLFLNQGETVIYTFGRDPQLQRSITAETAPLISAPVMVLVNNRTASASEIVATALHDNCRAVLVGEKTFGKGLIQSVFELDDGSGVVVTIGKYVTPSHMDINGNGIEPDFTRRPALSKTSRGE
ncbi:carboxyl-terminal-processing peptidase 1, chloroplastic isoform X2 [Amborella trichopoda]|uniref:carboxyl-terminal-processing peptidase 1, chloroplastic isoform X2 n=1 Tax=Amborella trichopoda TaxID=13333 RepID=UPI0009BD51F6|nr:carboxyl-terminal-processing peptidase 1, chloroplastic isoform X2 [Amborella trichopoda]|eukprot:XP_020519450.1 carboxyl-terminal-processing peptidase 1, chloroplastic isoform X2 [Amborella trichopoda]